MHVNSVPVETRRGTGFPGAEVSRVCELLAVDWMLATELRQWLTVTPAHHVAGILYLGGGLA